MRQTIKSTFVAGLVALIGSVCFTTTASAAVTEISGAGATFPYPIYSKWAEAYNHVSGVKLNYQAIGSGGGIKQIEAKTVDFGASDAPLTADDLNQNGLMQYPMVMGGVVPVVNLEGIQAGQVRLSGSVLADIYLHKVKYWDDPEVTSLNQDLSLPHKRITVVHRSDGSGTTWIYTNYLSKVSPAWKSQVGNDKSVAWPAGVGGKGNAGVASYVLRIRGSIGYVEYAYALQNHMSNVLLQNQAGNFVAPTSENFQAAAAHADWANAPGFYMVLTDQPGAKSWPITGATFILMHKSQAKPEVARAVLKFFSWSYKNGDDMAAQLDYVPMPDNVVDLVQKTWSSKIRSAGGGMIWGN